MTGYDVVVIGGGPAGLAAALVLARACRSVLLIDDGHPRNAQAPGVHNFLTRDGIPPTELLRIAREEVERYGVEIVHGRADRAQGPRDEGFVVTLSDGTIVTARKLLLATGVRDVLPPLASIEEYYGCGIYHCPYCDGWEHRGQTLAALGAGNAGAGLALALRGWSEDVVACTQGEAPDEDHLRRLGAAGIPCETKRVVAIEGPGQAPRTIAGLVLEDGRKLPCAVLFFNTEQVQRSPLPAMLGCRYKPDEQIATTERQGTGVRGLFLAGDADGDVQFAIVAAAEGATAAVAINRELQEEDLQRAAGAP